MKVLLTVGGEQNGRWQHTTGGYVMQRRYRMDKIEVFRVLWVAVVGSPGAPYRVLVEL